MILTKHGPRVIGTTPVTNPAMVDHGTDMGFTGSSNLLTVQLGQYFIE